MRSILVAALLCALVLAGCRDEPVASQVEIGDGSVTISGDDAVVAALNWTPPAVTLPAEDPEAALVQAGEALAADDLYATADSAIPLYLGLASVPGYERASARGHLRYEAALFSGHRHPHHPLSCAAPRHRGSVPEDCVRTCVARLDPSTDIGAERSTCCG